MLEKMSDKRKKVKKSRMSSEESESSSVSSSLTSSSDEQTDAKDLKPIKEYLSNRKELASQLFKSVKAEKICLILPQILKKIELHDLEELCATELIGMSKARIISIINGQEMFQSSDTEDSDDSGPSLEIISDTEWLSENEVGIKVEGSKNNKDVKKLKKIFQDKTKQNSKLKIKSKEREKLEKEGKSNVKVKMENVKTENKEKEKKEKEGESLLDLLELEMRARAIRALIRKEEDASNRNSKKAQVNDVGNTPSGSGTSNDNKTKERQANLKEQLEKIDVLMKHGEDEDVFVVINPAPTIELLSSDSETEDNSKRINQKLVNERKNENVKVQQKEQFPKDCNKGKEINKENNVGNNYDKSKENITNCVEVINEQKNKSENGNKIQNHNDNADLSVNKIKSNINNEPGHSNEQLKELDLEEGEIIDDDNDDDLINQKVKTSDESLSTQKIKKVKKNLHLRCRKQSRENDDNVESTEVTAFEEKLKNSENKETHNKKETVSNISEEPIEIEESPERLNDENILNSKESKIGSSLKIDLFDDKSLDIEEVINLDDYPDDMDIIESGDNNKEVKEISKIANSAAKDSEKLESNTTLATETWATRYYQQDDVQNVIRESKIQSEIRKRLRERQRQSKMNNSPKQKEQEVTPSSSKLAIVKPTGSVEEYLALKKLSTEKNLNNFDEKSEIDSSKLLLQKDSLSLNHSDVMEEKKMLPNEDVDEITSDLIINKNKIMEQSVVIIKKAKLHENIVLVKKVDSVLHKQIFSEPLNSVAQCDDSNNTNSSVERKTLSPMDEQSTTVENNLSFDNDKIAPIDSNDKLNLVELHAPQISILSSEGDVNTLKYNNETNNTLSSDNKVLEKLNQETREQVEYIVSTSTKISELRPD